MVAAQPRSPMPPRIETAEGALARIAEDPVHHFCAVGQGRPDGVPVDRLRGGRAVVPTRKAIFSTTTSLSDKTDTNVCLISRGAQS
jgi:hypothetical protein